MMHRRQFSKALWGLSVASLGAQVQAQSQSVKLLVGFAAGGSVDLTARALADALKDSWPLYTSDAAEEKRGV